MAVILASTGFATRRFKSYRNHVFYVLDMIQQEADRKNKSSSRTKIPKAFARSVYGIDQTINFCLYNSPLSVKAFSNSAKPTVTISLLRSNRDAAGRLALCSLSSKPAVRPAS